MKFLLFFTLNLLLLMPLKQETIKNFSFQYWLMMNIDNF